MACSAVCFYSVSSDSFTPHLTMKERRRNSHITKCLSGESFFGTFLNEAKTRKKFLRIFYEYMDMGILHNPSRGVLMFDYRLNNLANFPRDMNW